MADWTDEEFMGQKPAPSGLSDEEFMSAKPGILSNVGADEGWTGVAKNAATTALAGASHIPGLAGDIEHTGNLIGAGIKSIFDDRGHKQIMEDDDKIRAAKEDARVNAPRKWYEPVQRRAVKPPSGEDIFNRFIKPVTGEYEPTTYGGELGRAFGEAAVPMLALPGGAGKAGERIISEAPGLIERGLGIANRFLRKPAVGGSGGVTGKVTGDVTGNPFLALAGSLVGPAALEGAIAGGKSFAGPQFKEAQARSAGKQYAKDFTDPKQALEEAGKTYAESPLPHEAGPSFAEATKDKGAAQSELAARLTDEGTNAAILERQEGRNKARGDLLESTSSPAATGAEPGKLFREHLDELDKRTETALPDVGSTEEIGARTRSPMVAGKESAESARSKLFDELEEKFGDRKMVTPATKKAAEKLGSFDPAYEEPPTSISFIKKALAFPEVVTFGNLRTYLKSINKALQQARTGAGQSHADVGELKYMKGAVMDDIENAIANQTKFEQEAVANGQMDPDATFAKALQRQRDEWRAAQQVEQGGGGPGGSQPGGAAGDSGVPGAAPSAGQKPPGAGGTGGAGAIPGGVPDMDPAAAAALKAAHDAQRYLGETYRQGTPAKMLAEKGFKGNWNVTDSAVPRTAFPGGPDGYTVTKSVLDAGGGRPEMAQALKDTAIMTLRGEMQKAGGRLTPEALQKWRNKYQTSLNALDEAVPGFSDQFNNLANTQSAMAAKFAGHSNVSEAVDFMGDILRRRDAPTAIKQLVGEAQGEPAVLEGMKKLVVDHMMKEATKGAAMSGDLPAMSGPRYRAMLRQYEPALRELFPDEHLRVMDRLASDFESSQRHQQNLTSGIPGSPTAQRFQLLKRRLATPEPPARGINPHTLAPLAFLLGEPTSAALAIGAQKGLQMLDALTHNMRLRSIRGVNDMYRAGMTDPELGMRMLKHGIENVGDETWAHRVNSALLASPLYAQPGLEATEKKRRGHASGGKVTVDHAKAGAHLVGLVEKARKMETARTKPLLNAHDDTVAHALAIANSAI